MNQIQITWNGHSCFTIEADGYSVVLDPYAPGSVPGLAPLSLKADQVLCSHEHKDHGFREAVELPARPGLNPFHITVIDTFHDDRNGAARGSNKIHIFEAGGQRAAHLGDLGCRLGDEELALLKDLDALMIPVGGYYTIDAGQAKALIDELHPRVVIPMHYRSNRFGYPVIGRLEEFTRLCDDVVSYDTDKITVSSDTKPQTAVLTLL